MHLPNIDGALVPEPKISGYLLADDHPAGRSKAVFFNSLGFRKDQPAVIIRALLQQAASNEVSSVSQTRFGAKYLIDGRISGSTGTAVLIRSVWFIEDGERSPRFIAAYPLRGVQK
jgi:hypothetical protein